MDGLKVRAKVDPNGGGGRKPMWRRVVDPQTGEILAVKDPPNWPQQDRVILLDPNREYNLFISGVTDMFTESKSFNGEPAQEQQKFIFEFTVKNSAKWNGTTLGGFYRVPREWSDPRGVLPELAFALMGHRLEDDEDFDIQYHLLNQTPFKAWIVTGTGKESKKQFNKIERHTPIVTAPDDDFVPDDGTAAKPVKTKVAKAAPVDDDGVPDDFISGEVDSSSIPF